MAAPQKDAIEKIQSIFVTQQEDYKAHSEIHFQRVVSLFQDSQKDSWKSALGAMSAVVGAMVPAYILRLVWLTLFRPKRMEKTDILRQWYKPVYRDLNGNMHYKLMRNKEGGLRLRAGWLLSLLVGGSSAAILLCGRAVLSAYWHAQSSKQKNVMAKAESLVKVEMQQLQSMWQGTLAVALQSLKFAHAGIHIHRKRYIAVQLMMRLHATLALLVLGTS